MNRLRLLLALIDAEALAAFAWTFLTPSESGHAVLLWLSPGRLALSALLFVLAAGLVAVTVHLWRSQTAADRVLQSLDTWCLTRHLLGAVLIPLFVLPLLILAAMLRVLGTPLAYAAYRAWAPDTFPLLHALISAALPLMLFALLLSLQTGFFLARRYRLALTSRETWAWQRLAPSLMLLLIAVATVLQWLILAFQLRFFVNIPAWYWKIDFRPFGFGDLAFVLVALVLLALIYWLLVLRKRIVIGLMLVFALGWFLQIGVGLMASDGFASMADRYFSTYHKAYVVRASENHFTILENIQRYEQIYGGDAFTNTKPPGLMTLYIGADQLINGYPSAYSDVARYERLSAFVTFGFPLIATCMVVLLYAFARRGLRSASDLVPGVTPFLYVIAPAVALFSLFPDQAIYPLVFLLGVWLTVLVVRSGSIVWAFLLGLFLYCAVFFAFTMLPLYPFVGLYLLLDGWRDHARGRWRRQAWMALAVAAGTLALYLLFIVTLHYNFLPRFERTMSINHNFDFYLRVGRQPPGAPESLAARLGQIVNAAWVNNLDFAAGIGFPLYILFVVQAIRLVSRFLKAAASSGDIILLGMLASFVVLNLAGTAQGEVPRLWLFWLPMVAVLAAMELEPCAQKRPALLPVLAVTQLITIVLTFHFQDLRM